MTTLGFDDYIEVGAGWLAGWLGGWGRGGVSEWVEGGDGQHASLQHMQAWVSQPCLQPCCLLPQLPFLPLAALAAPPNLTSSRPGCDGSPLHCTALHCTALHCTALHCTAAAAQGVSGQVPGGGEEGAGCQRKRQDAGRAAAAGRPITDGRAAAARAPSCMLLSAAWCTPRRCC